SASKPLLIASTGAKDRIERRHKKLDRLARQSGLPHNRFTGFAFAIRFNMDSETFATALLNRIRRKRL
ncbi:MAG: hypothetical protein AAGJ87_06730, partial [Pseudomonadota bacterium]